MVAVELRLIDGEAEALGAAVGLSSSKPVVLSLAGFVDSSSLQPANDRRLSACAGTVLVKVRSTGVAGEP